jgi:DNA-directed RNA polymerase sigma subunit (sigma70/sigma32)
LGGHQRRTSNSVEVRIDTSSLVLLEQSQITVLSVRAVAHDAQDARRGAGAWCAVKTSEESRQRTGDLEGIVVPVEEALRKLSSQEEQVLRLLFGIGALRHSRDELVRRLGLSPRWLRRIEARALRNLRIAGVLTDARGSAGNRDFTTSGRVAACSGGATHGLH